MTTLWTHLNTRTKCMQGSVQSVGLCSVVARLFSVKTALFTVVYANFSEQHVGTLDLNTPTKCICGSFQCVPGSFESIGLSSLHTPILQYSTFALLRHSTLALLTSHRYRVCVRLISVYVRLFQCKGSFKCVHPSSKTRTCHAPQHTYKVYVGLFSVNVRLIPVLKGSFECIR